MHKVSKFKVLWLAALHTFTVGILNAQCPVAPSSGCDPNNPLDLYWVGTDANHNGNWNEPCSWRVGSTTGVEPCQAPRSFDNVYFTNNSFGGASNSTVTINNQSRCDDFFVDPSLNSLSFTPKFRLENPGQIEIYGSFQLQDNLTWKVVSGHLGPETYFKASDSGHTIDTKGHELGTILFEGVGGEWTLANDIKAACLNFIFGEFSTSDGVNDYDMDILTFSSTINTGASSTNRIMNLNSSKITVRGVASQNRYDPYTNWQNPGVWEAYNTTNTNTAFNAGTSEIIFTSTSPFIHIGAIDYNKITHTGTGRFYSHFASHPTYIDTFETNGYVFFHHQHHFNVFKATKTGVQHDFFQEQWVDVDFIVEGNVCEPTTLSSEYTRFLNLPATISSSMEGFIIDNLRCNVTGGGTQYIGGYGVGNTSGWDINSPTGRNLYWVGDTNNNWTTPSNWSTTSDGLSLLDDLTDCPPTIDDDVFFISPLTDGDNVFIDDIAYCKDMTWDIASPATFSGSSNMNIYGNLEFDLDMNFTSTSYFYLYGTNGNTIYPADQTFRYIYFQDNSDYELLGNLYFSNLLYLFQHSSFKSNGWDLDGLRIHFRGSGTTDFSCSEIRLSYSVPWYCAGSQTNVIYDSNTHVFFENTVETEIGGWSNSVTLPNVTQEESSAIMTFRDHMGNDPVTVKGNLILNGSARFRADEGNSTSDGPLGDITIEGDLVLGSDQSYEISSSGVFTVEGDVYSQGACASEMIVLQGFQGESFDTDFQGALNFQYSIIGNSNALTPYTVNNCVDLGGNTNWTINAPSSSTIFYWRGKNGTCPACDFNEPWNSPSNWTTNISDTEGGSSCIPGPSDIVVFDDKSFNGGVSNVSISGVISCKDIIATNTNVSLSGNGDLYVSGSIQSDGTLNASSYLGTTYLISTDPLGESIDLNGTILGGDLIVQSTSGTWDLLSDIQVNGKMRMQGGIFNSNDYAITLGTFNGNGNNNRTLNLGSSLVTINGAGNWNQPGSVENIFTWDSETTSNFTFNANNAIIDFTSGSEAVMRGGDLNYGTVNFTNTNSITSSSPVLYCENSNFKYLNLLGSARIYNDNTYDTLHFNPGKTYILESGSTQTLNAPNGILRATGTGGNEIFIKSSVDNSDSYIYKENTGGENVSFCLDYLSVKDNVASSDDPVFNFFVGLNSDNVGETATGIWDFTRALFVTPSISAPEDQHVCPGSMAEIIFTLEGSGPHFLEYSVDGGTPVEVSLSNGESEFMVQEVHNADATYTITYYTADNCGSIVPGTIIDNEHHVYVDTPNNIAINNDSSTCILDNENSFIHFIEDLGSKRPLVSIRDRSDGIGLGAVTTSIRIEPTVQSFFGTPYLQRYIGISPTNEELADLRFYFTQAELDALSAEWGTTLTYNDITVTKFNNDNMDMSGTRTDMTVTSSGSAAGITGMSDTYYVEVSTSSFSTFFFHPMGTTLPIELLEFSAKTDGERTEIKWTTATEVNNEYFTVERSANGMEWEELERVPGAGNSNENLSYITWDNNPLTGMSYYRLKQTDFDGTYTYSEIESVENILSDKWDLTLYPNPNNGISFTININGIPKHKNINVSIINGLGNTLYEKQIELLDIHKYNIQPDTPLKPGYYFVKLETELESITKKMVVE